MQNKVQKQLQYGLWYETASSWGILKAVVSLLVKSFE